VAKLLRSPDAAVQMGQAARLRAQQMFSWRRHVSAYDALYQKVVTGSRGKNGRRTDQPFA